MSRRQPVDRRTRISRQYEQALRELSKDIGDMSGIADRALCEQAALLITRMNLVRTQVLNGAMEAADDDRLVRLSNSAVRVLTALRGKKRKAKRPASLDEYLATGGAVPNE